MDKSLRKAIETVFQYPAMQDRQHGPRGYVDLCHLNRPALVAFRRNLLRLLTTLAGSDDPQAGTAIQQLLGFPDDLPDLSRLRPPGGNDHPEGIAQSCHTRRQRGELPHVC